LNDGSEVRLTISRYYTPSGRSIQKPYDNLDEYEKDLMVRYKKGEFFSADSIRFNDSLKFETTGGRSVYGGGGIMPDYFVPLDTSSNSRYFNQLFNANILREYAFSYAHDNKEVLKEKGYEDYLQHFEVTQSMINDVVEMGRKDKIQPDYKDLMQNKRLFQVYIKAEVARHTWKNENFYPVFNETNEVLQQAIKLFDRIPELNRNKM
jgi:carboxyl-terminal processing protease